MKNFISFFCLLISFLSFAQKRKLPVDTIVTTNHITIIKGEKLNYQAQTGTQPVWDDDGNPIASYSTLIIKEQILKVVVNVLLFFLLTVDLDQHQFGCI